MNNAFVVDEVSAPPKTPARRLSRRGLLIAAAALGLVIAAAAGAQWWLSGRYIESTDDAYVGGDVTDLAPKVSGLIALVAVTDNQAVRAGDLLVTLDDRDFRVALRTADAAVGGQAAALDNLRAMRNLQLSVIDEARADVAAAAARGVLAGANESRYRALAASHAGSVQDFQSADATYRQAQAACAKAAAALAAATAQLSVIDTQTAQARAALEGARAAEAQARLNLGYTQIRAPVDGVVGNRSARRGGYATEGAPLLSLVPARGLWVDANFKEDQLARMRPGEAVEIVADVAPGIKIRGHVANLAPATGAVFSVLPAENATGNFTKIVQRVPVRIILDGDAATLGLLRPGLSVTASVETE
jgi:membrane fusion protein (multidrug efflux system)